VNELVRTFHLERSDENFIRFVYDLVKNDQREYYGQYRLYVYLFSLSHVGRHRPEYAAAAEWRQQDGAGRVGSV
jgi:hypothetical protein